ncbi:MAG: M16 family metallopeptidase [Akkermansia sp.]
MRAPRPTLALLLLLGLLSPLPAQDTPAPPPAPEQAEAPLAQDPELLCGRLPNGLSYIIRHTDEPAGRGSLRLFVNTGSLNEDESNQGISHFLEHMVFNGSRHFKRGELIPAMQRLGLGFGGDANAYTSLLRTVYQLDLPKLDEPTLDFAFTILRDFADGATLEDEAIDHERGIVISELKVRDSASYRAGIAALRQLCAGTRVPDYLPIGKEDIIRNAPYEVVRRYYRDNYLPQRMTVIVTGDFEPAAMEERVRRHFADMEDRGNPPRPDIGTPSQLGSTVLITPNNEQADLRLNLSIVDPWTAEEDSLEQRVRDLPLQLACAMLNRRLQRMSKQADCPFNSAAVGREDVFECARVFELSITAKPERWQEALAAAEQELRRAARYGFSATELRELADSLLSASKQSEDTWDGVSSDEMADLLVDALADHMIPTAPAEDGRALRAGLAVVMQMPDICRRALEEYVAQSERFKLTMSGAVPEGTDEGAFRRALAAAQAVEVQPAEEDELKPFAYETIGEPGQVVAREELPELGVTTLRLSNGVRVNLKPTDFSRGSVAVRAAVDGGKLRLLTPGLATMAQAVMAQGGLEAHSTEDLRRLLAGHRVQLNVSLAAERFLFDGTASCDDLELQCKLLAAAIAHPGFRPEGEQSLRRKLDATYTKLRTTPQGVQSLQGNRVLFGRDPRLTMPDQEEVEARSTAEVRAAVEPWLRDGAVEVTLVGDFRTEEVLPILERSFGALPPRRAEFTPLTEQERRVDFAPAAQRVFLRYPTELDKTIVSQVRTAGNGRDHRRNRRLAVLASIVREKLFDGLRAELGESYSPTARLSTNSELDNAALITTSSAGVRGNRIRVNSAMDAILADIGRGQLTQDDVDCALRPFVASMDKTERDTGFWLAGLTDLQSEPERRALLADRCSDARSITLAEINELAREIFGRENAVYLFTVPEGTSETEEDTAPTVEPQPTDEPQPTAAEPQQPYAVLISEACAADATWMAVAQSLLHKHPQAQLCPLSELSEEAFTAALRRCGARLAALVAQPQELRREVVTALNRAARAVDDDPWGDCLTGIITGADAAAAQRLASDAAPLHIRRLLATTNADAARFEHSCCITDWEGSPVLEQSGRQEPVSTPCPEDALRVFTEQMEQQHPQLLITSSHATQFNLEMPFGKGLLFSAGGQLHALPSADMDAFSETALPKALDGDTTALRALAAQHPALTPNDEPRVWLAAGNCLLGDAAGSAESMAVTALSSYGCRQLAGYTVPSWYGRSGWGSLGMFFGNTEGTDLAEAVFLNNQFLLYDTQQIDPKLLDISFDGPVINLREMLQGFAKLGVPLTQENVKDAVGLVHDRDVLVLYGDPAYRAELDNSHARAPFRLEWQGSRRFTLTANADVQGERCAVLFPASLPREAARGCDAPDAVFTNDFILFPALKLRKGESRSVTILGN